MIENKSRRERFEETARQLEYDVGEAKFNERPKKIAKPKDAEKNERAPPSL